jgi:tripartite-type tricarboxylate transporter receptor subunit TctC
VQSIRSPFNLCLALCLALSLVLAASATRAQTYPDRPIRMIVPFAPGGATDVLARTLSQKFTETWGQQVVVENRTGAGGNIGADIVAKAAPDGYTLLMGAIGPNAVNAFIFPKMPYDTEKDFAPITQVARVPMLLVVHPSLPVKSVKELIAYAQGNPDKINFASGGIGASQHLAGELFKSMTGVKLVHVAYKGAQASVNDVLAGQAQITFGDMISFLPHAKAGKVRPIAVTTARRSPVVPDLPTISEAGVPGYEATAWYGLFAPAGTPAAVVNKLSAESVRILKTPEVAERVANLGAEPVASTPAEYADFLKAEMARWGKVVRSAGIKSE